MIKFKTTDVTEVTLLSIEEAKTLPKEILAYDRWWWLRSPGYYNSFAPFVDEEGCVFEEGLEADDNFGVRPVFLIPILKSFNLKIGDIVEIADVESFVISNTMALAKEPVGYTAFREDYNADNASDYEASDVKKWIEDWWKKKDKS